MTVVPLNAAGGFQQRVEFPAGCRLLNSHLSALFSFQQSLCGGPDDGKWTTWSGSTFAAGGGLPALNTALSGVTGLTRFSADKHGHPDLPHNAQGGHPIGATPTTLQEVDVDTAVGVNVQATDALWGQATVSAVRDRLATLPRAWYWRTPYASAIFVTALVAGGLAGLIIGAIIGGSRSLTSTDSQALIGFGLGTGGLVGVQILEFLRRRGPLPLIGAGPTPAVPLNQRTFMQVIQLIAAVVTILGFALTVLRQFMQ